MNPKGYARTMVVSILLLLGCLSAFSSVDRGGMPPWDPIMLGDEFAGGNGTASNPYLISNVFELQNMSLNLSAHYVLTNDIDASVTATWNSGAGFAPVGSYSTGFSGSLEGMNHTITGLFIDRSSTNYTGLFGNVNRRGSMMNVGLVDVRVTGRNTVGGLVGHNDGTVSNCLASGNVTGRRNTGGLVGYNDNNGKMFSSRTTCDVAGDVRVGGLVGLNDYVVSDSHAAGSVIGNTSVGGLVGVSRQGRILSSSCTAGVVVGTGEGVGGLVGNNHLTTVEGSHATSDVVGTSGAVGGLVGWSYSSTVSDSFATGNVSGDDYLGGLVGWMDYRDRVSRSYATGNVSGIDSIAGGLVGYHHQSTVEDSYARGNVIRSSGTGTLLGGFVGFNDGDVSRCYSTGKVTYEGAADPTDKGLAGGDSGTFEMTGNFWDNQTSLQTTTSGNATGMDTMEMRTRSTFADAGWDFDSVWCMIEGLTYPLLRWQDAGPPTAIAGPDQTVDEGIHVTFDGSKSIDDIGIVKYTWTFTDGTPVTIVGARPSYQFKNPGIYVVTLNTTDAVGNWDIDTMTVTVNYLNNPPAILTDDIIIAHEDISYKVEYLASDPDPNDILVWSLSTNASWLALDALTGVLSGLPTNGDVGTYRVNLTVTDDSGASASHEFTLTVLNAPDPPVLIPPMPPPATENVPYSFDLEALDPDAGDSLTWSMDLMDGWLRLNATTGVLSGTPSNNDVGNTYLKVTVTDSTDRTASQELNIVVLNVNDPPEITTVDVTTATEDEPYRVVYATTDVDAGDVLTWSFDRNASWLSFNPATGVLSGLPTNEDVGIYYVNLTVTDIAGAMAFHNFTLTVLNVNDPPMVTSMVPPLVEVDEDEAFQLNLTATDIDDTLLTWSDDTGLFDIGPANGSIAFLPTQACVGEWWANVTVRDAGGLSDTVAMHLVVRNVNDAPVITSLEPTNGSTFEHDALITLSARAEDEDRDELTLTWRDGDRVLGSGTSLNVKLAPGEHRIVLTVSDGTTQVEGSTVVWVREGSGNPGLNILPILFIIVIVVIVVLAMTWRTRRRRN